MPEESKELAALQAVYKALKGLDSLTRAKVLASAQALLEGPDQTPPFENPTDQRIRQPTVPSGRPLSLVELIQDKDPKNNPQRIATFAYYREKYEGLTRFAREDLKAYFSKARVSPPANYDRDFVNTVESGWVHEDGSDSYITSKGLEAVERGFTGLEGGQGSSGRRPRKSSRKKIVQRRKPKPRRRA